MLAPSSLQWPACNTQLPQKRAKPPPTSRSSHLPYFVRAHNWVLRMCRVLHTKSLIINYNPPTQVRQPSRGFGVTHRHSFMSTVTQGLFPNAIQSCVTCSEQERTHPVPTSQQATPYHSRLHWKTLPCEPPWWLPFQVPSYPCMS